MKYTGAVIKDWRLDAARCAIIVVTDDRLDCVTWWWRRILPFDEAVSVS